MPALTQSQREPCDVVPAPPSQLGFLFVTATLFLLSAALTIRWCYSMSGMDMPMPGGWTMSMTWMRIPGQNWLSSAAEFVLMWTVMMVAMMLPSFAPKLWHYRETRFSTSAAVSRCGHDALNLMAALVAAGYFFVWTAIGLAIFPVGTLFAKAVMNSQVISNAVPFLSGIVIVSAGVLQVSPWKAHHLTCCREAPMTQERELSFTAAWRDGVRFGLHCARSCAGLTSVLLVVGVMDLRAMAIATIAITAERLLPSGDSVAKAIGAVTVVGGLIMIAGSCVSI